MAQFRWPSANEISKELDLRRQGWDLAEDDVEDGVSITIIDAAQLDSIRRLHLMSNTRPDERRMMLSAAPTPPQPARNGSRTASVTR